MHWQFTPYVLLVIVSAAISAVLACSIWHRRSALGAATFGLLMLAVSEWSLAYALELGSPDLPTALFWDNIAWLGVASTPTLWLVFVLQYSGRAGWLTRRKSVILVIEPLVTLLLVWTNAFHGLIGSDIRLDTSGPFSALVMVYGTWYWINLGYSYLVLFAGSILVCLLIRTLTRSTCLYLRQVGVLLIVVLVPWGGSALTTFGLNPFPRLHLTPFTFTITGLAVTWSLFRFRFLDIVPVARAAVFESMSQAIIVVDEQNRVVDLNLSAQHLANCTASRGIGQAFTQVFAFWPELVERYHNVTDTYTEIVLSQDETVRYFDLRVSHLYQQDDHFSVTGRLIVLNDVTEHIQAERSLRESEERFHNIFEEAPIGMAVVSLDDILLQVNKAFCEMLEYHEQELVGHSLSMITHPDDVRNDGLLAAQMLKGMITSYKVEKRYLRRNHEMLWADLTATMLRHQDGQAIYRLMMLENVFERKRAKLLEEERRQVAYELHDGLAQVAASTHQHLQAFASDYRPHSLQARETLDRALELAQRSVREARRLITDLRPTALDDFGLAIALRLQVESLRAEGWIISYYETLGSERLSTRIETTLFGVVREAFTNARKHAHTIRARVALERQASKLRLEVQDWGCGFEPLVVLRESHFGEHIGLREMQERVELVGGHFMISSQLGIGTLVVAEVPLLSSNEEEHGL